MTMHPRSLVCLGLLLAIGVLVPALGADTVRLRHAVRLDARAEVVRLADVAELDGPAATALGDLVVGTLGDPHDAVEIDLAAVRAALDAAQVNWSDVHLSGRRVIVRPRLAPGVSPPTAMSGLSVQDAPNPVAAPERPEAAAPRRPEPEPPVVAAELMRTPSIRATIASMMARGLDVPPNRLRLVFECREPSCLQSPPADRRGELEPIGSYHGDRVEFALRLWADGVIERTVQITVRPEVLVDGARARRDLARNTRLAADDLTTEPVWMSPMKASMAVPRAQAIGLMLEQRVDAGDLIHGHELHPEQVIRRGDRVFVRVLIGRHAIKLEAEALADGVVGEEIRFRRVAGSDPRRRRGRDRDTFAATVVGPGQAVIDPLSSALAGA